MTTLTYSLQYNLNNIFTVQLPPGYNEQDVEDVWTKYNTLHIALTDGRVFEAELPPLEDWGDFKRPYEENYEILNENNEELVEWLQSGRRQKLCSVLRAQPEFNETAIQAAAELMKLYEQEKWLLVDTNYEFDETTKLEPQQYYEKLRRIQEKDRQNGTN